MEEIFDFTSVRSQCNEACKNAAEYQKVANWSAKKLEEAQDEYNYEMSQLHMVTTACEALDYQLSQFHNELADLDMSTPLLNMRTMTLSQLCKHELKENSPSEAEGLSE